MSKPLRFVARAPRSAFGQAMKALFWVFLLVPPVLMFGTCAATTTAMNGSDPDLGLFAFIMGGGAIGVLSAVWLFGVPIFAILALMTRGRLMVIEQPPPHA
ncbi:hypothetical protein EOD42_22990 [Rhodovarius crocodyli]|uniref:Uncharacterized protein n=1 Tax=Rhodovarius crocodyli TaxID=1979269 RepID=A0A437LZC5_9PROT|nr:hypothetical protein [Rhodovarius crocodyli]RVT90673.1 hypothetical protein EOD42_22990 [Rhodovarius crocodyli]